MLLRASPSSSEGLSTPNDLGRNLRTRRKGGKKEKHLLEEKGKTRGRVEGGVAGWEGVVEPVANR